MRVLRSSLFVAATAIIAAACGDKVTVPPATTAAAKIQSVTVSPPSATISVGQTVNLTAAVNADAGITPTVAWTSSSSAATLSATTGTTVTVTGATASPGVAVCAKASAASVADVTNCATVIIQPAATIVPAVLQIASVTVAGNLNAPVNTPPGTMGGQVNVSVNLNPGTEKMDSVVVQLNGKTAATQIFTSAQAAALRSAANDAGADQALQSTLVFPVNTAAYSNTTGAATFPNGAANFVVIGYGKQGSTPATNSVTSQGYLLFNADAWILTQTIGTTTTANNAAGFAFGTGSVAVSAIPVLYSANTIASANVNFGTAACDLSGGPQRTKALTAPAAGTFAWTASFAKTSATTAGTAADVNSYEYSSACASNATGGEGAAIASSQYATTNVGPTALALGVIAPVVRLDNRAPTGALVVNLNPNGRANSWINDAVTFNGVATDAVGAALNAGAGVKSNGMICNNLSPNVQGGCPATSPAPTDAGVGGVTFAGKVGATIATAVAASAITNATTLAASATNATYCLALYSSDALGNTTADPAACSTTFGVDRAAPSVTYSGGIAANSRFAAVPAAEFSLTVNDTGLVGNSGMLPVAPVTGTVALRSATVTSGAGACYIGTFATATGCSAVALNGAAAPIYTTAVGATMAAAAGPAYYTFNASATDAAGNTTVAASRVTVVDQTAAVVGTASAPLSVTPGTAFTISAFLNEDLSLQAQYLTADYAGAPAPLAPVRIAQGQTAIDAYNAATFTNTNFAVAANWNLPYLIQANVAAGTTAFSGIEMNATNQANTLTTGATVAPLPAYTAPTAISTTGFTSFGPWAFAAGITGVSTGLSTAATTARPLSITLTATVVGVTATFNNPFSRIDVYATNVAGTEWRLIGSTNVSSLNDNGVTRTFTSTITLNGATVFGQLGGTNATITPNVIALGYNANGSVAMLNSAALALPIVF